FTIGRLRPACGARLADTEEGLVMADEDGATEAGAAEIPAQPSVDEDTSSYRLIDVAPPTSFYVERELQRSRLKTLPRPILVLPHLIVVLALMIASYVVAIIGWFAALILGRLPDGIAGFLESAVAYSTRVSCYARQL